MVEVQILLIAIAAEISFVVKAQRALTSLTPDALVCQVVTADA
jgi:hypothetical protein